MEINVAQRMMLIMIEENREEIRPILNIVMNNLNISEDEAFIFHMEAWVYTHGRAGCIRRRADKLMIYYSLSTFFSNDNLR